MILEVFGFITFGRLVWLAWLMQMVSLGDLIGKELFYRLVIFSIIHPFVTISTRSAVVPAGRWAQGWMRGCESAFSKMIDLSALSGFWLIAFSWYPTRRFFNLVRANFLKKLFGRHPNDWEPRQRVWGMGCLLSVQISQGTSHSRSMKLTTEQILEDRTMAGAPPFQFLFSGSIKAAASLCKISATIQSGQ